MTEVRVVLPAQLRLLAHIDGEVVVSVEGTATADSVLDCIEERFPMLRGTIRDHVTQRRRPFLRYFACGEDISHRPSDTPLPESVCSGEDRFIVIGAIAGG